MGAWGRLVCPWYTCRVNIHGYDVQPLTRKLAAQHQNTLAALANLIPQVEYTAETILAECKGDRGMLGKWKHSLVVMDAGRPIAMVMGYERRSEGNEQYPANTLYITELAVHNNYQGQGIARALLSEFFAHNNQLGFVHLDGSFNYSIQTNSADWNRHVRELYESFGFRTRATKPYNNRTDVVMGMTPAAP